MTALFTTIAIAATLTASVAVARGGKAGFPANCRAYEVCEGTSCIKLSVPYASIQISKGDTGYLQSDITGTAPRALGYFADIDAATRFLKTAKDRAFGSFVIPNADIADAFGLTFYTVTTKGNAAPKPAPNTTKLVCSQIHMTGAN